LRAEHAYTGGYTIVKDYVRSSKIGAQEMFVPLTHAPGKAQADFGEAQVVIAGVAQRLRGHTETIAERFERDRAALLPLPAARFEACDKTTARVSSISLVRYRTNDYSVPTQYGHRLS
jgi:hypothetical protein